MGDSAHRAPFVSVIDISNNHRWTYSDLKGYFSIVVYEGDTLLFSCLGYKKQPFIIPKNLDQTFFSTVIKLQLDAISLPQISIFALTPEEFKRAFLALNIPDDDLEKAKKNMDKQILTALSYSLPKDGQQMSQFFFNYYNDQAFYNVTKQQRPIQFLNPFAIAQFFRLVQEGKITLRNDPNMK